MKLYVATRLSNIDAAKTLLDSLRRAGHEITYDWTVHGSVQDTPEKYPDVAHAEMDGVRLADVVVSLMPGGRGTHCEIGGQLILGKPVLLVGTMAGFLDAGNGESYPCVFHHHNMAVREIIQKREIAVATEAILRGLARIEQSLVEVVHG